MIYNDRSKFFADSQKTVEELQKILQQAPIMPAKTCQWPTDNPDYVKGRPHYNFICTEPLVLGRPYCQGHCKIAYTRHIKSEHGTNYNVYKVV